MMALSNTAERNRVWTISNFLSFSRLLFLLPALFYLHQNTPRGNWIATGFFLLSGATDWWDGFLARKLRQQSELGRIIDPLMDKISVGTVAVYLSLFRDFPAWFLLLILSRDFIIITLGLLMTSRQHKVPESNWYGKVTVTALAIVLLTFVLDVQAVKWPFFWSMVCIFFISIASYARRFATEVKK
jgi:CDP-diacylglycerol--glycerol-3-phosphate 3-phosphatidyltransferase